ncbi:MAG: DUF6362 family protein [Rickettsiales bacterium]|jgi:hypothetical protein|nr:DUF6362 family protein [Rickettsiales bacterium]
MKQWTAIDVVKRFESAVYTLKRLPPVRVMGYKTQWPAVMLTEAEKLQADKLPLRLGPPLASAISEMEETIQWIFFLDDELERRLVWLRAARVPWKPIVDRLGYCRTTLHYRYRVAIYTITIRVNLAQRSVPRV